MMGSGSGKQLGSYHDLPRSSSSAGGSVWTSVGLQHLLLAVVAFFLIPSILFAFVNLNSSTSVALRSQRHQRTALQPATSVSSVLTNDPRLIPAYEYVDGTEYVWQIPSIPKPKGVLFLAHGCQCRSTFFWDKHPQCMNCTGMPEERTLVLQALHRGYAVIAVSSTSDCWNSIADTEKVIRVLKTWISDKNLDGLPVFGLGASSGGYFLSVLAVHFKFQALVLEISSGTFEAMDIDASYPPTLFVHMPKDKGRALRISEARDMLSSKGVRNDEVLCYELRVTPHFFSERIPHLSKEVSEKIVAALHQYGYLTPAHKSFYMKSDGRQTGWKMALRKGNVLSYEARVKWERPLEEEMNLAYAYHEFTSLPSKNIFEWFQASLSSIENSHVLIDDKVT